MSKLSTNRRIPMDYIMILVNQLASDSLVRIAFLSIALDVILGVMASMVMKKISSTVGIDGVIRKCSMVVCIIVFMIADLVMSFNLAFMIPAKYLQAIGLDKVGLCEFFCLLFIAFELLSCCKNAKRLGLPIPKKIDDMLGSLLTNLTDEGE